MAAQQRRFDDWRAEFNDERPHDGIGGETPASRYAPSPRPMPARPPDPEYPGHLGGADARPVRQVSSCGTLKLKGRQRFISQALAGETIAFEEVADGA